LAPYIDFVIIGAVAAVVTFLMTFVVRRLATRFDFVVEPDARRVHERPTPTVGGAAMFVGFLAAMAVASRIPQFSGVFRGNSEPLGLVLGAAVIFAVGMADDLREMSPPAKMSGQVLAGTVLYLCGVTMFYVRLPLVGTTLLLSPQLAPVFTVLWVVGIANAINLIDGLDGLATGIVAIASVAFFVYSHELLSGSGSLVNSGPVVAAIVFGLCIGFLPHNFHPARIFMGDAGAMLLGLLMAGSTMSVVGQTSQTTSGRTFFTFAPILIPFFILSVPLVDTAFAVVRRARLRTSPAVADKNHLHHRLLRLGHGQRRSVLILWAWTALLSGLVLYPSLTDDKRFLVPVAAAALAILLVTVFARSRPKASVGAGPPVTVTVPSFRADGRGLSERLAEIEKGRGTKASRQSEPEASRRSEPEEGRRSVRSQPPRPAGSGPRVVPPRTQPRRPAPQAGSGAAATREPQPRPSRTDEGHRPRVTTTTPTDDVRSPQTGGGSKRTPDGPVPDRRG
jgi:UDP-GlcNAc:undecaprenyl-phosphate/decaprenyl-phosphate GlcNAc-1-phosphate transferase